MTYGCRLPVQVTPESVDGRNFCVKMASKVTAKGEKGQGMHGKTLKVLLLVWLLTGCQPTENKLVITGSSTIAPLMAELVERFEAHSGVQVDVQSGGSGRGISDVRQGLADLGMVSRALKADEQDLTGHLIARDGIALIVHQDNPLSSLSRQQVVAIYTGKLDSWADLGGAERAITVVHKADGRSTQELFLKHFGLDNDQIRADLVIGENQQGIKAVSADPFAIGYVSIGTAIHELEAGAPLRLLPLQGVPASLAALEQGDYPLGRELNLVSAGEPDPHARALLAFITDPAQAEVYRDYYFLPAPR